MKDLLVLLIHRVAVLARLAGPGDVRGTGGREPAHEGAVARTQSEPKAGPSREAAAKGLPNSKFSVHVACGHEIGGMGRIVGDAGCWPKSSAVTHCSAAPESP